MKEFLYFPFFFCFPDFRAPFRSESVTLFTPSLRSCLRCHYSIKMLIPCHVTKTTKNHYNSRKFLWECWRASHILSLIFQLFFISAKFYVLLNYAKKFETKNLSKFLVLKKKRIKVQSSQLFEVKFGEQLWILSTKLFI
jgi:hypothetical protein